MSKLKRTLLYSLLLSSLAVMPVSAFGAMNDNNNTPKTEQKADSKLPTTEPVAVRFYWGGSYGRGYGYYGRGYGRGYGYYGRGYGYYGRPYYYGYPYRSYYYYW